MNMQGFCTINLYKSREFSIEVDRKDNQEIEDAYGLFETVKRETQDVTQVIDGASAILSQNGSHVVSVRNSQLSDMMSVKTPRTQYSKAST
jgi:hypothetical protein